MVSRACCLALASRTALYMVLPMWNQFLLGVGSLKRHVLGTGAISYCKKTCQDWYNDQWLAYSPGFVSWLCSNPLQCYGKKNSCQIFFFLFFFWKKIVTVKIVFANSGSTVHYNLSYTQIITCTVHCNNFQVQLPKFLSRIKLAVLYIST